MVESVNHRNRRLSENDVKMVVTLVSAMPVNLRPTWSKIIELTKTATGHAFTRQALFGNSSISAAYQAAINRHHKFRKGDKVAVPKLQEDSLKDQQIAQLKLELSQQRELVNALQDMLVRFVGNAVMAGVSQDRLEAPLPSRAEWRSDIDLMAKKTKEARRKQQSD